MDQQMRTFLDRLVGKKGPVETAELLRLIIARSLSFAGVSRAGRKMLIRQLAEEFKVAGYEAGG
jgi:hypothetical protein